MTNFLHYTVDDFSSVESYQKSHVAQSTKSSKSFLLGQLSYLFVSCIDTLGAETIEVHTQLVGGTTE